MTIHNGPVLARIPDEVIDTGALPVNCFHIPQDGNIHHRTVRFFGEEWKKFDRFDELEIRQIGADYFDILPQSLRNGRTAVLDVGCGSGRWASWLAPYVGHIDCIDPSEAVFTAAQFLKRLHNVRICRVDIDNLPFENESFDMVYSLGVLHHIPDAALAMKKCVEKVKRGGYFLAYLYYDFENRGILFKSIFRLSTVVRRLVSPLPAYPKKILCDLIAYSIYLPLSRIAGLLHKIGGPQLAARFPLCYYRDKSMWILKNDALDRFGTPLEQRFSRLQIEKMMRSAGLTNIIFSEHEPFWHVIGQKQ